MNLPTDHANEMFLSESMNQIMLLLRDVQYEDLTKNLNDALREYVIKLKEFRYG